MKQKHSYLKRISFILLQQLSMISTNPKKRKLDEESREFNEIWTNDYFFILQSDNNALCLLCNETIKTLKIFNVKRHYETRHKN